MKFKKVSESEKLAPKIEGHGGIGYCLWNDDKNASYIQFIGNQNSGTYSKLLFPVSEYKDKRLQVAALSALKGYDAETGRSVQVDDNNNGAFLKAVLRHLFPKSDE